MSPIKATLPNRVKTALRFQRMKANKQKKFHSDFHDPTNFNTVLAGQMERKTLELTKQLKKETLTEEGARVLGEHANLLERASLDARNIRGAILRGESEKVLPLFEVWKRKRNTKTPLEITDFVKFLDSYALKQDKRAQGLLEAARRVPIRGPGARLKTVRQTHLKS
ncbi:MAG: hypothetical protein WCW44_02900 [archaeon]|jgi:hypothetical protein